MIRGVSECYAVGDALQRLVVGNGMINPEFAFWARFDHTALTANVISGIRDNTHGGLHGF